MQYCIAISGGAMPHRKNEAKLEEEHLKEKEKKWNQKYDELFMKRKNHW